MKSIRNLFLLLGLLSLTSCALFFPTADAYVKVNGELAPGTKPCAIRFASERLNLTRGEHNIAPGSFSVSFLFHYGEKLSDFRAELSCGGSEWRYVGPSDAFLKGSPVELGVVAPQAAG
jgi:hypothetical protein